MEAWVLWGVFAAVVLGLLALDLGVFHRKAHAVSVREALTWTALWVSLGLGFGVLVYFESGGDRALAYLTCYLTEYALSVDNIFVFLVVFTYFGVPSECRHRVLFWGIVGAALMRGLFLLGGVALITRFHWMTWILGGVLLLTALKLLLAGDGHVDPARNPILRLTRRLLPVHDAYDGARFFTVQNGRRLATPLFLTLLVVESTDVVFALDSVPAALAISHDPLVLYTSNLFAILGLRSLFFAVAGLVDTLHYLRYGLAGILAFVGVKMLLPGHHAIPIEWALGVVGGILATSVLASLVRARTLRRRAAGGD